MRLIALIACTLVFMCTMASAASIAPAPPGGVARIYISPGYIGLPAGSTQRFRVFGVDCEGSEIPVPGPVSWEASSKAGRIASDGTFTAVKKPGVYDSAITASVSGGLTATAIIEVFEPVSEGGYKLDRMWGSKAPGQFDHPQSVAVDAKGFVYVADTGNHRIQKLDSSGRYIASWGTYGSGRGQFRSPSSVAVDSRGNVYVADSGNCTIQKFTSTGRLLMSIAGVSEPNDLKRQPVSVAVDTNGDIYVGCRRTLGVDPLSSSVSRLDRSGRLLASFTLDSEVGHLMDPRGIAVYKDRIYVADRDQNRITVFDKSGKLISNIHCSQPLGAAVASNGTLYVVNNGGHDVQKYDSELQQARALTCTHLDGGYNYGPTGVAVSAEGYVYVLDQVFNTIHKYDPSGKCVARWGTCDRGQFLYVYGVATDSRGDVYATDAVRGRIHKFDPTGDCITCWGSGSYAAPPVHGAHGITVDGRGYVYVVNGGGNTALVFDSSGNRLADWQTTGVESPVWVAADSTYNVFITGHRPVGVTKFDCAGRKLGTLADDSLKESPYYAGPVAIGPDGTTHFVNAGKLCRFDASGKALSDVPEIDSAGSVAVDGQGNIFVACSFEGGERLKKLSPSMAVVAEWGSAGGGPGQFESAKGIAVSPDGSVYLADFGNTRIQKFVLAGK